MEIRLNRRVATSLADDCVFLVEARNTAELTSQPQEVGNMAINWRKENLSIWPCKERSGDLHKAKKI